MKDYIVINATALGSSGALTILEQFIEAIPADNHEYVVFINSGVKLIISQDNIRLVNKDVKSFRKRFIWDTFGIKNWLREHKVLPLATISLQNTNFRTKRNIPNFIYYHQSIPFFGATWNPFCVAERELWFYKNIYPFFVRLFINKKTEVFVQSTFIKESFAKYFDFPLNKIHIISPRINLPALVKSNEPSLDRNQLNLFYPATTFVYKNHSTILKALSRLDKKFQQKITLHLTCEKNDLKIKSDVEEIQFKINFMGKIDFARVQQMYNETDALLFPSFIETIGLPLIEAASYGMKIIVSDLPYSREVLFDYEGVVFVPYNDARLWSDQIMKLLDLKGQRFSPLKLEQSDSWKELFRIVEYKIR
jgi:glycosyltransferase involved in cell wall biosynthesis